MYMAVITEVWARRREKERERWGRAMIYAIIYIQADEVGVFKVKQSNYRF